MARRYGRYERKIPHLILKKNDHQNQFLTLILKPIVLQINEKKHFEIPVLVPFMSKTGICL
jgi:hypothetical protein